VVSVLLVPVLPVAAAVVLLLRGAAGAALVGLLAGSPADAPGVVIARPDGTGVAPLVGLLAVAVCAATLLLAAGLLAGAGGRGGTVAAAGRRWVRAAPPLVALGLALGTGAALVAAAAVVVGGLRFQLTGVVLVLGWGPLVLVGLRLSLAPAVAAAHGHGLRVAVRRAWAITRGETPRLALAALGLLVAVGGPVAVLAHAGAAVLDGVAATGTVAVSPLAAGWWTVGLAVVGTVVATVLWGLGTRAIADDAGP
jgi:hypothetical protein